MNSDNINHYAVSWTQLGLSTTAQQNTANDNPAEVGQDVANPQQMMDAPTGSVFDKVFSAGTKTSYTKSADGTYEEQFTGKSWDASQIWEQMGISQGPGAQGNPFYLNWSEIGNANADLGLGF